MAELQKIDTASTPTDAHELEPWQIAIVDLFVHAVQSIGLPRSLGQIYGLLYGSEDALSMQDITDKLRISKASASQGLKMLRQFNAVKTVFVIGTRREHYAAEMSLRRLVHGLIGEVVEPHLQSGQARLEHLNQLVHSPETSNPELAQARLMYLNSWHEKTNKLLPVIRNVL